MITDTTAHALARDLAAMREITHAALDVIAEQQRKLAQVTEERDNLREEIRRYIRTATEAK